MSIEHGCKNRQDNEPLKKYLKALANETVLLKHKIKRIKEKLSIRPRIKYRKRNEQNDLFVSVEKSLLGCPAIQFPCCTFYISYSLIFVVIKLTKMDFDCEIHFAIFVSIDWI